MSSIDLETSSDHLADTFGSLDIGTLLVGNISTKI